MRVGQAYVDPLRYVEPEAIEPGVRDALRELIRVLSASPYPEQKRRFYASGMFYDHLLEELRDRLEPKPR